MDAPEVRGFLRSDIRRHTGYQGRISGQVLDNCIIALGTDTGILYLIARFYLKKENYAVPVCERLKCCN
jgi:hypothetical protein